MAAIRKKAASKKKATSKKKTASKAKPRPKAKTPGRGPRGLPRAKGAGQRAHRATPAKRRIVRQYKAIGIPNHEIARSLHCSTKTLLDNYSDELETAKTDAVAAVGNKLYELAMDGNFQACKLWMEIHANWNPRLLINTPPESDTINDLESDYLRELALATKLVKREPLIIEDAIVIEGE